MISSSMFSTFPLTEIIIDINVLLYKYIKYHVMIKKIYKVLSDKSEQGPH